MMNRLDMAIPPEVFPTLSAVVRTRADWDAMRREQYQGKPFRILAAARLSGEILSEKHAHEKHAHESQEHENQEHERYAEIRVTPEPASQEADAAQQDDIYSPSLDVALQARQDQLIEAASAISQSMRTVNVTPTLMMAEPPIWKVQGARAMFGFNALVLIAAIMVSVLSYRNLNATREVVALMDKVNQVGSIETRIAEKLDRSNLGVQTLINETNSRISFLQTQVSALPADTKGIVKELGDIARDMMKIPDQLATAQQLQPLPQMVGDAPAAYKAPRPKRVSVRNSTAYAAADIAAIAAPKPLPAASKAFRRIVAEDGSVKFEKIR